MNNEHHNPRTARRLRLTAFAAVAALAPVAFAACGDDDEPSDETTVEPVTSEVTETSSVSVDSEVTLGTTMTSEVEVTEVDTETSEVEMTEPGVTSEG